MPAIGMGMQVHAAKAFEPQFVQNNREHAAKAFEPQFVQNNRDVV